ncbi:YidB family protein [Embleya sp. NPDC050154]|uniref:YidB family protein n=1 Tax=Embleya sp. NPDC050154 TaxID=3363988 RepID=UPI0037909C2B
MTISARSLADAGLESQVRSWIGDGPNEAITAEQIVSVVGENLLVQTAASVGQKPSDLAAGLAAKLPGLVDGAAGVRTTRPPPGAARGGGARAYGDPSSRQIEVGGLCFGRGSGAAVPSRRARPGSTRSVERPRVPGSRPAPYSGRQHLTAPGHASLPSAPSRSCVVRICRRSSCTRAIRRDHRGGMSMRELERKHGVPDGRPSRVCGVL